MPRRSEAQLRPRNGSVLVVGIVARISGCSGQKEISLEDQIDHATEEVSDLLGEQARTMQVEYRIISTKRKGERLDRPELAEIEGLLRSGTPDLFVMEGDAAAVRSAHGQAP